MKKENVYGSFGILTKEEMLEVKQDFKKLKIGIPKETSFQENRISLTPDAVSLLVHNGHNLVIIDTAGRLHIDDKLILELREIIKKSKPDEILYVADGMTGQDAVNSSKVFSEQCDITGCVITKMDGDSGGGVALSIKEVTDVPIKFIHKPWEIKDEKILKLDVDYPAPIVIHEKARLKALSAFKQI